MDVISPAAGNTTLRIPRQGTNVDVVDPAVVVPLFPFPRLTRQGTNVHYNAADADVDAPTPVLASSPTSQHVEGSSPSLMPRVVLSAPVQSSPERSHFLASEDTGLSTVEELSLTDEQIKVLQARMITLRFTGQDGRAAHQGGDNEGQLDQTTTTEQEEEEEKGQEEDYAPPRRHLTSIGMHGYGEEPALPRAASPLPSSTCTPVSAVVPCLLRLCRQTTDHALDN